MVGKSLALSLVFLCCFSILQADELFIEVAAGLTDILLSSHAWCDINDNGLLDIGFLGRDSSIGYTEIFINNGDGTFSEYPDDLFDLERGALTWSDFDNDGYPDLLICGGYAVSTANSATLLYRNNGDGTFSDTGLNFPGVVNSSAVWADFSNNGLSDFLLTGDADGGPILRIFYNNGDGSFTETSPSLPAIRYGAVAVADFDNDGLLDILLSGRNGGDSDLITELYRNLGDGVFEVTEDSFPGLRYGDAAWGDFDNDGYPDILLSGRNDNGDYSTLLYRNLGNSPAGGHSGFEVVASADLIDLNNSAVAWCDFDNDGYLDLFISGRDDTNTYQSKIYRNSGHDESGNHLGFQEISFELVGVSNGDISWGDFDNDGKIDLLMSGLSHNGRLTSLLKNNTGRENEPPLSPVLTVQTNGRRVDFLFSGSQDDTTPEESLLYDLRVGYTPGGIEIYSPLATDSGFRKVPESANLRKTWYLLLEPGYYFAAAQAIDHSFTGSPFSNETAFFLIDPVIDPLTGSEIRPSLSIIDIAFSSFISITSSWEAGNHPFPETGLSLILNGSDLSGAQLTIDPDLGFIPYSIACRAENSEGYSIINNPGSWKLSEINLTIPSDGEINSLEIIFPARSDDPLPLALSSFLPLLTPEETVLLEWVVEAEINLLGYNLFRSESENLEEGMRINPVIIPATNSSERSVYSFTDLTAEPGISYFYWLEVLDLSMADAIYGPVSILVKHPEIEGEIPVPKPVTGLKGIYPNPFNSGTTIRFFLTEEEFITLDLFNLRGELVRCLASHRYFPPGEHSLHWDGSDSEQRGCSSGIYLLRLRIGSEYEEYRKVCRMK